MMMTALPWGILVLLCQQVLVRSHVVGRTYSASDLAQLKNLLERFEETIVAVAQAEDPVPDYEDTNPDPEQRRTSLGWDRTPEGKTSPPLETREPDEGHSQAQSQKSRLQDLLMATRSKLSGCFGGRLDRIGTSSGLGCNVRSG
uniref:Atrial natriuretic peptide n=1 Tax=Plecoglossus altivelis TaxID=61084 RepID=Q4AEF1_PLEAT|nr:atrial natriuretic peptide [Plecoglossus altivelis]